MSGQKRVTRMRERTLKAEHKEFILNCLACCMAYGQIQERFEEEFEVNPPSKSTISGYQTRHEVEIERRREDWRKSLKSSRLPFVEQYKRVAQYGHFAQIEIHRKRYKEAREHMRAIAEETGDLRQKHEHSGTIQHDNLTVEQRLDRLNEIAEAIIRRSKGEENN